jgi:Na+-driven multidrug efflux pump
MKDLTEKPILGHLLQMTIPIFVGMLFQTLYFLIDLYFVARIGDAALAGVGAAGNVTFLVIALTQVLGVGTVALISHAAGRKDRADAILVFNQSLVLSATCALITLAGGYGFART